MEFKTFSGLNMKQLVFLSQNINMLLLFMSYKPVWAWIPLGCAVLYY